MRKLSFPTNMSNLGTLLQGCIKAKVLQPAQQIHAQLMVTGVDKQTGSLYSKLIGAYAGCGDVKSAGTVFRCMHKPPTFAWNWMISASAFQGDCESAIGYLSKMQENGAVPNKFTFSCVLKACVGLMDVRKGKVIHCMINAFGFESDVSVSNALVDMYSKCGVLDFARKLFDRMTERDVASWTSMIYGYSQAGNLEQSLNLFEQMKLERLEPNEFTWNAIIAGYARCGDCNGAFQLFSRMKRGGLIPDLVTWNAMISGFAQNYRSVEAIRLFAEMLVSGVKPNAVTIAGLLPACGLAGSLRIGKQVHGLVYRWRLDTNVFTSTALIDMYSRCGTVNNARRVFDHRTVRSVASWNVMIGCYGKHGMVDASIQLFETMQKEGVQANQVTFTSILSACSHAGYLEKGLEIFEFMQAEARVELCKEHYSCMVDLLCRAGRINEAYQLVKEMAVQINDSIMGAFLNGCKIHGRSDLARKMAEEIVRMPLKPACFVTLSNIYAAYGEWEWVESVRKVMHQKGLYKEAGFSWVEKNDSSVGFKA